MISCCCKICVYRARIRLNKYLNNSPDRRSSLCLGPAPLALSLPPSLSRSPCRNQGPPRVRVCVRTCVRVCVCVRACLCVCRQTSCPMLRQNSPARLTITPYQIFMRLNMQSTSGLTVIDFERLCIPPSVCPSVHPFKPASIQCVCPSDRPSVRPSANPSIYLFVCLSTWIPH